MFFELTQNTKLPKFFRGHYTSHLMKTLLNLKMSCDAICLKSPKWYNAPTMLPASGRQHHRCIIPQAVTHSLVLLKMGKIISRNMLS